MKRKDKKKLDKLICEIAEDFKSQTDVLGSYTGVPDEKDAMPTQDADDL